MSHLYVHYLPELVPAEALAGNTCVVIDVLRATTTIIEALANGAAAIAPCLTIEAAHEQKSRLGSHAPLLGGERAGRPIAGFDLGNSPAEYSANRVGGRSVALTTTNGTKALLHCQAARTVLVAGLVNLSAIVQRLRATPSLPIDVLCAGTDGLITREDVLLAGAIVAGVSSTASRLNDEAFIARDAWHDIARGQSGSALENHLIEAMRLSRGGRNLIEIGMAGDIELAARVDRHAIVPEFHPERGLIELGSNHA